MQTFKSIPVAEKVNRATFENEIKPSGGPVVLKGLVAHWDSVHAANVSPAALGAYIKRHDVGRPVEISVLPKALEGKFFYNDDVSGLNFKTYRQPLSHMVDWCLAGHPDDRRDSVYAQAQEVDTLMPEMTKALDMPLLDRAVRPRIWIANTVRTQTHFDLMPNIACHVAGKKTFTLFPPNQVSNLYPGPLEITPAGVPISMVELENPDFERFPRFREALASAQQAHLEPGDALYIPPLWWHHVQTTGPLNMLVNYWWGEGREDLVSPFAALYMTILSFGHLPPAQKRAWQALVNHYAFDSEGDPMAHLPKNAQGMFNHNMSADDMRGYRMALKKAAKL